MTKVLKSRDQIAGLVSIDLQALYFGLRLRANLVLFLMHLFHKKRQSDLGLHFCICHFARKVGV